MSATKVKEEMVSILLCEFAILYSNARFDFQPHINFKLGGFISYQTPPSLTLMKSAPKLLFDQNYSDSFLS